VDAAATLLRLCYIQDLRALQSQVTPARWQPVLRVCAAGVGFHPRLGVPIARPLLAAAATAVRPPAQRWPPGLLRLQVDGAIVAVQEMTANPRTDACLGKVGR
jgi:hypothetical protein